MRPASVHRGERILPGGLDAAGLRDLDVPLERARLRDGETQALVGVRLEGARYGCEDEARDEDDAEDGGSQGRVPIGSAARRGRQG